jgi:hypothetical protein
MPSRQSRRCGASLDMGVGFAVWYSADGELAEDEVVHYYGTLALRSVGLEPTRRSEP